MEKGSWIWENPQAGKDEYADFRQGFSLAEGFGKVELRIAADSAYAAWVNGCLAGFGQYHDFPHRRVYSTHDITEFCRPGENTLLVTAWHWGITTFSHYPREAGVIFRVSQGEGVLCASGAETLCRRNPYYVSHREKLITWILGYGFRYDAAGEETDWHPAVIGGTAAGGRVLRRHQGAALRADRGCGGGIGLRADVGIGPYEGGFGEPKPVENLELWEPVYGQVIGGDGKTHFLLDLGREEVGFLAISLESDTAQNILIAYGEHLVDGSVPRIIGDRDFSVEYGAKAGENRYMNPFRRLGCRYLEVFCQKPIRLHAMGIRPVMYPVNVLPFDAGNPLRQKIYDTAVRTLRLCIHEHYEDCPWREQALYGMDSRNQMLFGYHAFGETKMPRACLALFGQDHRADGLMAICAPSDFDLVIPSFILHWYQAVLEYTEFSKDLTLAQELWPRLCGILRRFWDFRDENTGLIPCLPGSNYWNFYEWTDEKMSDPDHVITGTDLILNCLFLRAIQAVKRLGAITGLECGLCALEEGLTRTIRKVFCREDGIFTTDPEHRHVSELGCALAILTGVAEESGAMCDLFTAEDKGGAVPVSLSMTAFVYDALLQVDKKTYAPWVLADIDRRCGYMLYHGATTFWETMEGWRDFDNAGSLCHGWSALAAYYYRELKVEN